TAVVNCTFDSNYVEVLTSNGSPAGSDIFYGYGSNNQTMKAYVFNTVITGSYHLLGGAPAYTNTNEKQYRIFYTEHTDNRIYVDYSAIEGSADQSWADDKVFDIIPVYTDRSNGDYSINNLSPVIGQGTSSFESISAPSIDILGASRPSSNPDMGAYENSLASSDAPLPLSGIVGTAKTNSVHLTWPSTKSSLSSTSDAANIQYLIYQGGSQVGTSLNTSFTVSSLTNGATYSFKVAAQDTITTITGAPSRAISITPTYTGPYWYVASSGGSSSNTVNADLGSREVPLNHMSSAIESAAAGDTIVMMKGTHTGSNNRGIDWNASKSLVIMGDPDYVADSTIIDAGARDRHFTFDSGEDTSYQVIGLTLYNGKSTNNEGGGSVSMTNNSSPVFRKVIFKQNVNLNPDWEGGGAVSARNYSRPSFYYCIFDGNTVQRNGDTQNEANGGAVWIQSSSQSSQQFVLFDGCTFKNNVARGKWGARGGAIRTYQAQVLITNSLFYGNMTFANEDGTNTHSSNGGAIHITGPSYYSSNEQQWVGSQVKIINSTIVNNLTKTGSNNLGLSGSGIYLDSWGRSEKAWFFNNIVWGNKTSTDGSMQQVYFSNESGWGAKYLNYNVVQSSEAIASMQDDNSFETDPTFSDSTNGDYSLANSSILIGKGGASYEGVSAPNTDLLGLSRPNPYGSSPDIGAYENNLAITPYPAPVKNLTAVGGSGSVTLTWDAAADADSVYKVYKRDGAAFSIAAAYYLDKTTENNYTITGLDNDTRYYFRVAAVNKEGYEGTSAAIDITPTYSGPMWWVSTAGNDDNEGSSGSPFKSIEHAIGRVTAGDTVMLKQGTYTGSSNRGIEISTNDQEINYDNFKNVVITSEKGPDSTIIYANYQGNHFVLSGGNNQGLDSTFQFIGLTFANGRSNYPGGSFVIQGGNGGTSSSRPKMQPKFENCIFKNNEAKTNGNDDVSGGAFSIIAATPIFENCLFENNRAWGAGGAIDIQQMSSITDTTWIRNTVFRNNISHNEGNSKVGAVEGGAIKVSQGINLIISGSNFNNNQAIRYSDDDWQGVWGGAIQIGRGWDTKTNPLIRIYNSRFSKNKTINYAETQADGGAINAGAPIWIANSVIDSNLVTSAN
ncbi:MAG: fibronectin type III domain-containing protein, partial [Candidatus Marinimicrobia bacterium]|nr:fibronectin type III domain-containing protein [Candidatus Neomarinimicrobiota bacterium]